jgi:DNA-binding MarR family transcriptional regulator
MGMAHAHDFRGALQTTGIGHGVKSGAYMGNGNTNGRTGSKRSINPNRFVNRWGKIKQIHIPNAIIRDGKLELSSSAIAVLLTLLYQNKNKQVKDSEPIATVKVGQEKLIERTGFKKNTITKAVTELQEKLYLKRVENRKKKGEFGTNEYFLCNPQDGEPLPASRTPYLRKLTAGYFTVPDCIVKETNYNWSLAKISESELRLYTVLLYLANRHRDNEFTTTAVEMRTLSGLSVPTLPKAIVGLEERGLIWVSGDLKSCTISLCDPYTGVPLEPYTGDDRDDPSNYYVTAKDGGSRRLNLNPGDPARIEALLRSLVDGQPVIEHGNGELKICCPFHADSNPSCSVSPQKNGCFKCFGCGEKGSFPKLIAKLQGITKGEAIEQTAASLGKKVEFHDPDRRAIAKYQYLDANHKLLKEVLRYPNDTNGEKVIKQRRPAKGGGVIWDVKGLPSMLFHMEWLRFAGVVCIVEGERDACTVTDLHMNGIGGLVIGMTSGGAETWDASLAKHLRDKKVVVMPDNDDAGRRYAADVKASLEAEGIEYREVTFQDARVKDVTDYMADHKVEDLVRKIGTDWVRMPDGTKPEDESPLQGALIGAAGAEGIERGAIAI